MGRKFLQMQNNFSDTGLWKNYNVMKHLTTCRKGRKDSFVLWVPILVSFPNISRHVGTDLAQ
jgi:hypothetical protein